MTFRAAATTAVLLAIPVLGPTSAHAQETSVEPTLRVDRAAATPAGAAPSAAAAPREAPARPNRNVITREELDATTHPDALTVVRNLRPSWLRPRGNGGFRTVEVLRVYVDGLPTDLSALRQLSPSGVREMRFLDASLATDRFGTGHGVGAILVNTR